MNRIDRLFGILTFLQSRKYVTAEKIAEKFGISVRTVYRDVKALGEQGIPVSFEANKGYFVVQGYFLPPVSFSTEEANAFLLMETIVNAFADKSIQAHYSAAVNKINAVLKTGQREKVDALRKNIRLQAPDWVDHSFEYLARLQTAISAQHIIEIDYLNNKNESSCRMLEPIGLIFYAFNWHLIAWCHMRNDYRDFRASRILKMKDTEKPFTKPDHVELAEYMKQLPVSY
jgi:predicted DNA-binding transcriptional regulator YafY